MTLPYHGLTLAVKVVAYIPRLLASKAGYGAAVIVAEDERLFVVAKNALHNSTDYEVSYRLHARNRSSRLSLELGQLVLGSHIVQAQLVRSLHISMCEAVFSVV